MTEEQNKLAEEIETMRHTESRNYLALFLLARVDQIIAALREPATEAVLDMVLAKLEAVGPAHTYASENADLYRGFDNGIARAIEIVKALKNQERPDVATRDEILENALKRIRAWDMVHEPAPRAAEPCHDAPQIRELIDRALKGKGASQGQAYTFERYRNGVLMAEGIRVHASNLAEARKKAEKLKDEGDDIRARAPDEQKG